MNDDELKNEIINGEEAENAEPVTPSEVPEEAIPAKGPVPPEGPAPVIEDNAAKEPEPPKPEQPEQAYKEPVQPEKKPETVRVYTAPAERQYSQQQYYYRRPEKPEKKRSTGILIAVLAAVTALSIIFACCALVMGIMLNRNSNSNKTTKEPESTASENSERPKPSETDKNSGKTDPDKQADTDKTAETERSAPSATTDPTAVVQLGDSKNKYQLTEVAAMTVNSVVEIRTEQVVSGNFMQQYVSKGAGSGVIVTADGYIATNNHVIDGATSITVTLRSGDIYDAVLIGTDSVTDIAVVKIDAKDLTPASFGSSDKLVVAESVIAIGNPLGSLGGSVTECIISALARNVTIEDQEMTLMQTTAAINPGNSGGGLFNMSGECIGIVNAKSAGEDIEGIGFAIPSDTAVPIIEDLIRYGYVRGRVMLGVTMLEVNDSYTARRYGLSEFGVYIATVYEGSDADKAGMKKNDRIVSINGKEITAYNDVKRMIQNSHVGDEAEIIVRRSGENVTLKVVFTEYTPAKN